MPYGPSGNFTLTQSFGTGTAPNNDFPPQVGNTLDDIAASLSVTNLASVGSFMQTNVSSTTTVGFKFTSYNAGTFSSGTLSPNSALGNYQYLTNNGGFFWDIPSVDSAIDVLVINGASAGTITFSGSYTVAVGNIGDPFTTVSANKFIVSIRRINSVSTYLV